MPTDADKGKQGIIAALKRATELYLDNDVTEVAMSSAGNIDSEAKTITYATDNLPGMTGFDYGKFFAENYGLNVTVLNDAHAALLAEVYYGAAAHYTDRRVAMLTLGSGVGILSPTNKTTTRASGISASWTAVCNAPAAGMAVLKCICPDVPSTATWMRWGSATICSADICLVTNRRRSTLTNFATG